MLGCEGPGKRWALAETEAAFCLALDVSTTSAMGIDTVAATHRVRARL